MLKIITGIQQLKSVKMMANTLRASADSLLRLLLVVFDSPCALILRCDLNTLKIMAI